MFVFMNAKKEAVRWDGVVAKSAARAYCPAKLSDAELKAKLENLDKKVNGFYKH